MAGPPGTRVCVPMRKADWELAVMVDPSSVRMEMFGGVVGMGGARGMVEDPITRAVPDAARERAVPEMVLAGPEGKRVFPAMI